MKYAIAFVLALGLSTTTFAADTECEAVTFETVEVDGVDKRMGRFHSAGPVIDSLYDDAPGFVDLINDEPVVAIVCTRENLLPTLRDLPIIKTGLSFSLSQDFDSPDSGLLTITDNGKDYVADYTGPDALAPNADELSDVMSIFNLQRLAQ